MWQFISRLFRTMFTILLVFSVCLAVLVTGFALKFGTDRSLATALAIYAAVAWLGTVRSEWNQK